MSAFKSPVSITVNALVVESKLMKEGKGDPLLSLAEYLTVWVISTDGQSGLIFGCSKTKVACSKVPNWSSQSPLDYLAGSIDFTKQPTLTVRVVSRIELILLYILGLPEIFTL